MSSHPLSLWIKRARYRLENRRRQVDFMIIGIQKGGSTWLTRRLDELPYTSKSSPKETRFFRQRWKDMYDDWPDWRVRQKYLRKYWKPPRNKLLFEASPGYMASREAAFRIERLNPKSKFIVVMREPASRAFSLYNMQVRNGKTTKSFREFYTPYLHLAQENARKYGDGEEFYLSLGQGMPSSILSYGLYYYHLKHWFSVFPRDQFHLTWTRSLRDQQGMRDLLSFLGLDPDHVSYMTLEAPAPQKHSGAPMASEDREVLQQFFEPYNKKLFDFLGVEKVNW